MREKPSGAPRPKGTVRGSTTGASSPVRKATAAINRTYGTKPPSWMKGTSQRSAIRQLQDVVAESEIPSTFGSRAADAAAASVAREQWAKANPGTRSPARAPRKATPKPKGKR